MKERSVVFNAGMVRSILNGQKTQARWLVNPQPVGNMVWTAYDECRKHAHYVCPYGQPGDRLWVRESWCDPSGEGYPVMYRAECVNGQFHWGEDEDGKPVVVPESEYKWKSPISMPREASRVFLEITDVRVERLQDISEADALAEGHTDCPYMLEGDEPPLGKDFGMGFAKQRYRTHWKSINGTASWDANPWVWVVEFRVIPEEQRRNRSVQLS